VSDENGEKVKFTEQKLTNYIIKGCDKLIHHASISKIYLVFDGRRCPLKKCTNVQCELKRIENLKEARRLKRLGRLQEFGDKYRSCVKVTAWMADSAARAARKKWGGGSSSRNDGRNNGRNNGGNGGRSSQSQLAPPKVCCVVSPYEADAQLVKLCMDELTDVIITEDSDVLVYLAACHLSIPIIYKLNRDDGSCNVFTTDN
jgi:exonuclease-1